MYTYELWAWTYTNGYREWSKKIRRQKELTEERKNRLAGNFADMLSTKYNCNIALYGCNKIEENV